METSRSQTEDARPKTLAEHRQYLHEIVRLKVWYLWCRLHTYPEEDLRFVLRERVDIYRKTDLNPEEMNPKALHFESSGWLALEDELQALWESAKGDAARFAMADAASPTVVREVTDSSAVYVLMPMRI